MASIATLPRSSLLGSTQKLDSIRPSTTPCETFLSIPLHNSPLSLLLHPLRTRRRRPCRKVPTGSNHVVVVPSLKEEHKRVNSIHKIITSTFHSSSRATQNKTVSVPSQASSSLPPARVNPVSLFPTLGSSPLPTMPTCSLPTCEDRMCCSSICPVKEGNLSEKGKGSTRRTRHPSQASSGRSAHLEKVSVEARFTLRADLLRVR